MIGEKSSWDKLKAGHRTSDRLLSNPVPTKFSNVCMLHLGVMTLVSISH